MDLNDLTSEIKQDPASFIRHKPTETLKQVLSLVEVRISEVRNQAVKWYGPHLLYLTLRTYDF